MNHFNDISLMLPDYIAGRLSHADQNLVESAIKDSSELAQELEFQRNISKALKSDTSINPPGELGWARLSRDIKQENKTEILPVAANDTAKSRPFWRYAAAILAVAVIGQSTFIASKLSTQDDDRYIQAGETDGDYIVKVEFEDTALQSDITALIKDVKGNIIAGPTQQGVYSVNFETSAARGDAEDIFAARDDLVQAQDRP